MAPKRRAPSAFLLCLVVGVGACSSSVKAGDGATRPRVSAPIPARIKVKLGPCPTRFPRVQLRTLNAGVERLDTKLVPFAATSARVCRYSPTRLVASGTLAPPAVTKLEIATNALARATGPITCSNAHASRVFLVTFDGTAQRVHLRTDDACGGSVSNSVVTARATTVWAAVVAQAAPKKE